MLAHASLLMTYTFALLWHEQARFASAVLAVCLTTLLITLQWGLMLGFFECTSIPVDHTDAQIWVGAPGVASVDAGRPISETHLSRLASQPAVEVPELYILGYGQYVKPDGTKDHCIVIGSRLSPKAVGALHELTVELRSRLTEPGSIVVAQAERKRFGIHELGGYGEVNGQRVHVIGAVPGVKGYSAPYIFSSLDTARQRLGYLPDQTT